MKTLEMRARSCLLFALLAVLLASPTLAKTCKAGEVMNLDENFQEKCISCGENCSTCFLMEKKQPKCFFCKEGYFLDTSSKNNSCMPCIQGCSRCIGGSLQQCSDTLPGYFYEAESNSISKCDDSCHRCHSKNECSMCAEGFYTKREEKVEPKKKEDDKAKGSDSKVDEATKEKSLMAFGESFMEFRFGGKDVKCLDCKIDNCLYCSEKQDQVKQNKFINCSLCKPKFGLVDGRCETCPDHCRYCKEQTLECVSCEKGFQWNAKENLCSEIQIPNCASEKENKCTVCDNYFYLDRENNECKACEQQIKNCSHCNKIGPEIKCRFCERGFYLPNNNTINNFLISLRNIKMGKPPAPKLDKELPSKCLQCEKNCNHCDDQRCYICKKGFYYDSKSKQCKLCKIKNCDQCVNTKICGICTAGFFLDPKTKKCTSCPTECIKCSANGHCQSCPINHFILMEEKITHSETPNILSGILGMFLGAVAAKMPPIQMTSIQIHTKCVTECPKEIDGQKVTVNMAERKCIVRSKGDKAPLTPISLPFLSEDDSIYHNIMQLKFHYEEQIAHVKKIGLGKAEKDPKTMSSECYNNGLIRKVFRGNLSSYFICRCLSGFLGDNCQISKELHEETQKKLSDLLKKIKMRIPTMSKHDLKEVLSTLILFNKFKIDEIIISKIIEVVGALLENNRQFESKKKLYVLLDSLILSVFDLMEDIRKAKPKELMGNSDIQKEKRLDQMKIEQLVVLIETSLEDMDYSHSFLNHQKDEYIGLDTFSFIISEFPLNRINFQMSNPNIDTSFNTEDSTELELIADGDHPNSKYNLQIIVFSVTLFNFEFKNYELLTNPVYIKFLDSKNPHLQVLNSDALIEGVKLYFPLLFLPAYENLKKHLFCKTFKTGEYEKSAINGTVIDFDEDSQIVTCEYKNIKRFSNMYFGVFIQKRDNLD